MVMELNGIPPGGAAQPLTTEAVLRAAQETLERTRELIDQTRVLLDEARQTLDRREPMD
jgi:hypothetical protein